MHILILKGVSRRKNGQNLINVLFEAYFPRWRSLVCQLVVLYSEYLLQCLLFQFLRCGILFNIPSLSDSKRTHNRLKNGYIFLRNLLLQLNFQGEGHLHGIFLFYILYFCFLSSLVVAYICTCPS